MSAHHPSSERHRAAAEKQLNGQEQPAPETPEDLNALIEALRAQQHELQVHQIELELQNEELQRANRELAEARTKYNDLFEFAPVAYLVLNREGDVLEANQAASTLLGVRRERLLGRRFVLFVAPASRSHLAVLLRRVFESPARRTDELEMLRGEGQSWPAQLECTALSGPEGLALSCRVALLDQSVQKQAQQEYLQLNETLEARVEQRTAERQALSVELEQLSVAVAQELGSPLRHLLASTSLPAPEPEPAELRRRLEGAHAAAERLDPLVRAFAEVAGASTSRLKLVPVDLNRLLGELVAGGALDPGGRTQFVLDPLPSVVADRGALQQVFRQLLSNALKATRGVEAPRIQVCAREHPSEYVVCVRDNGLGFNMRSRDKLFAAFKKLHADADFPGAGVGLVIVRRLLTRLGGRVWAEGRVNEGATFWLALSRQPRLIE